MKEKQYFYSVLIGNITNVNHENQLEMAFLQIDIANDIFSLISTLFDLCVGHEQSQDEGKVSKITKINFYEIETTKFDSILQ